MSVFFKLIENIYFWVFTTCLAIIGTSASNIFHFAIEDHFQANIIPSYFMGIEYATSQSILIVTSILFIFIISFENKLKKSVDLYKPVHRKFFLFLACAMLTSILIYVILVIYGYFSGKSEAGGLQRIAVTLSFLLMGITSAYFRITESNNFFVRHCKLIEGSFVLLLCISTVFTTFHYASPKDFVNFGKDIKTARQVELLVDSIHLYQRKNHQLPTELNQLKAVGYLTKKDIDLSHFKYEQKGDNQFTICASFKTSVKNFRRQKVPGDILKFEKGEFCFNYHIEKDNLYLN